MKTNKKKKKGRHRNLVLYSAGIWDLLVLTGIFSSDLPALKSQWGMLNLDEGTLNLDGGTLALDGGTRPPYNLSAGYRVIAQKSFKIFFIGGLYFISNHSSVPGNLQVM